MSSLGNVDYYDLAMQLGLRGSVSVAGQMYTLCPVHVERKPSFSLNVYTGLWFCHTEQLGGRFEELVAHINGVSLTEAVMWVVGNTKVFDRSNVGEVSDLQDRLRAQEAYYNRLDTAHMCQWWFDRGFTWDDADYWGVRYDPSANEVIFPVVFPQQREGQWLGYIRRTFGGTAKYLNSPAIPRREILYGYGSEQRARTVLLCEGPTDAIAARRAGHYAVSSLGVYVTEAQLRLFNMIPAGKYVLALDSDEPGVDATLNIISRRSQDGLYVFEFPEGVKDVGGMTDDQIDAGVEAAIPADEFVMRRARTNVNG